MKTGLVLEGGAHRAIYTAGVLDVFLEHEIAFDGVIGVSAGAIHGCSFISKQKGRSINYTLKYAADPRYMSFSSWLKTGNFVGEEFCYHILPEQLFPFDHAVFEKSATEFYVTCSNVETGTAEYIRCEELRRKMPYLMASASLPFISKINHIDGKLYLDGGITDSIPLAFMQNKGYERCVVVMTRVAGYRKAKNKLAWLAGLLYRKYPKFAAAVKNRHIMYNRELEEIEQKQRRGEIFVIRPSRDIKIKHMEKNPEILRSVYQLGRQDAEAKMMELKKFLHKD